MGLFMSAWRVVSTIVCVWRSHAKVSGGGGIMEKIEVVHSVLWNGELGWSLLVWW